MDSLDRIENLLQNTPFSKVAKQYIISTRAYINSLKAEIVDSRGNSWPNLWNIPLDAPVRLEKDRKERAREGAVDVLKEYLNSTKAEKYYFWLGEEAERS